VDRDLSRRVVKATFRSARELQDLLPILKERASPEDYQTYLRAIAAVVGEGGQQLLNRVFAEHPDLEVEVDAAIKTNGRYD
jgi:hypothetical protein